MDVLTVPTVSNHEVMMVDYLKRWADDNQVLNWMDKAGNLYFVKGDKPMKGFFPCLSAHLDTVQTGQLPYIERGQRLPYSIEEQHDGTHKIFTEGMGIGADCKCGIAICLHLIRKMDRVKAVFFHNEEKSMEEPQMPTGISLLMCPTSSTLMAWAWILSGIAAAGSSLPMASTKSI